MKIPILIALGGVAALAGAAHAQTQTSSIERDLENKYLAPSAPSGVTIRTLKSGNNETAFYLIASKATAAQVLEHIAIVTGEGLVAAPALQNGEIKSFSASRFSLEGLIKSVTSLYQIQSKEIAPGVRFFAPPPIESAGAWAYKDRLAAKVRDEQLRDYNQQAQREKADADARENRAQWEELRADPRFDPFVFPRGGLDPKDRFGRPIEPQPDWEKREFNGHEFYHIPLPKTD